MYIYRLDAGSDSETSLRENIKPYSQFTHKIPKLSHSELKYL